MSVEPRIHFKKTQRTLWYWNHDYDPRKNQNTDDHDQARHSFIGDNVKDEVNKHIFVCMENNILITIKHRISFEQFQVLMKDTKAEKD